ncbi:MAG: hypothetical protein KDA81_04790 [Planctomycetaceae bacterium]|nr:hypothetical protein [Planctomycetaceae bacterium]
MNQGPHTSSIRSRLLRTAVALVIGFFFSVPVLFLLYGGLAAAVGGLTTLCLSTLISLPLLLLLKSRGILPAVSFGMPEPDSHAPPED